MAISWNAQGERSEQGEKGDKGDKGDPGEPGQPGTNGTNGTDGKDGTGGTELHLFDGNNQDLGILVDKEGDFLETLLPQLNTLALTGTGGLYCDLPTRHEYL